MLANESSLISPSFSWILLNDTASQQQVPNENKSHRDSCITKHHVSKVRFITFSKFTALCNKKIIG